MCQKAAKSGYTWGISGAAKTRAEQKCLPKPNVQTKKDMNSQKQLNSKTLGFTSCEQL